MRENVREGIIQILRVPSAGNLSDILTKATSRATFHQLRSQLGLRIPEPVSPTGEEEQTKEE